jgi:glycosyltransferase involved in cell wall biosynthesis
MTNTTSLRPTPSVTIALFCYNQESYIKDALESVLKQDYSPLKIIISDDASKDGTVQIIQNIINAYNGPHEISFNQNAQNLGLIKHINYISNSVDTDLLVAAAGDDISLPNRVSEIIHAYCLAPTQPTSIYSSVTKLSPEGVLSDIWEPPIKNTGHSIENCALEGGLIIGAAHAWHKSIYEVFGEITELGAYEDLVIAYRSAILGGLLYIDKPLVNYRTDVGISNLDTQNLNNIEKFNRYQKFMLPVLRQRLLDSAKISDVQTRESIKKIITRKINAIYLEKAFNQGVPIKELISRAFKSDTLMYLFKLFRRKIKKKLVQISKI